MMIATLALLSVPLVPYHWRNVEIVGGGFVTGVITHPKKRDAVFARTDIGGAYKWNPKTSRWMPLHDWITLPDWNLYGVESLAVDPNDANRIYLALGTYDNGWGGNGAIVSTANGGKSWSRVDLPFKNGGNMPGRSIGERLAVDPLNPRAVYFGTRNSGLWRSPDAGKTWGRVESFPKVSDYDVKVAGAGGGRKYPDGHGVGWVTFANGKIIAGIVRKGDNLYESRDDGKTWTPVPGAPKGLLPHQAKVGADGSLTVVYADDPGPNGVTDGAVWRWSEGRWTDVTPERPGPGNTFGYGGVSVLGDTIAVSTLCRWSRGDTVYLSTDSGRTWRSLKDTAHRDATRAKYLEWNRGEAEFGHWIGDVEIDPHNPNRAWYVTGATIWGTEDLHAPTSHWLPRAEGLEETAVIDLVSPPKGAHVLSGLGDIGGFEHWDLRKSPPTGMRTNPLLSNTDDLDFAGARPEVIVRVGRGGGPLHGSISRDMGRSWKALATDPKGGELGGSVAVAADGGRIVWVKNGARAQWTTDDGATWTESIGAPLGGQVVSDKANPAWFALYDPAGRQVYVSRDGGRSFSPAAAGFARESGRLASAYGRSGWLYLPTPRGLMVSADFGVTFRPVRGIESARAVGFGKPAPGQRVPAMFVIGYVDRKPGVFRSLDDGATWSQINDARTGFGTMGHITGDPKVFGRVYVGTNGRGVLVADPRNR